MAYPAKRLPCNDLQKLQAVGTENDHHYGVMNAHSDLPRHFEVDESNFEKEVLQYEQPVLVIFWASWSKACQMLRPVMEKIEAEFEGRLRVCQVDVDDNPELGVLYEVQSIPTLICYVRGRTRLRIVGFASQKAISLRLTALLNDFEK